MPELIIELEQHLESPRIHVAYETMERLEKHLADHEELRRRTWTVRVERANDSPSDSSSQARSPADNRPVVVLEQGPIT